MSATFLRRIFVLGLIFTQTGMAVPVTKSNCRPWLRWLQRINGGHFIHHVKPVMPDIDEVLPEVLTEFGRNKSSLKNTFKKYVLFNKLLVKGTRHLLVATEDHVGDLSGQELADMLTPNAMYNFVITGTGIRVGSVEVKYKRLDDLLSKHLLLSNFSKDVRAAGEFWKDSEGKIHFNVNSGTYKPGDELLPNVQYILRSYLFPEETIELVPHERVPEGPKPPKQGLLKKIAGKFSDLKAFDWAILTQIKMKREIAATTTGTEIRSIPLSQLTNIHPMEGVREEKIKARADALRAHSDRVVQTGVTTAIQNELIPSKTPIRVVQDRDGRYVIFDGNGRFKSISQAFADHPDIAVDVEVVATPSAAVWDALDRIRQMRNIP